MAVLYRGVYTAFLVYHGLPVLLYIYRLQEVMMCDIGEVREREARGGAVDDLLSC